MSNYGQEIVDEGLETLKGTWEYNGDEYDLLVENISYPDYQLAQKYGSLFAALEPLQNEDPNDIEDGDLEQLETQIERLGTFSWQEEKEIDFIGSMVNEKLVKPDVDIHTTSKEKLGALVQGMMETWHESDEVEDAREEMPIEGNP